MNRNDSQLAAMGSSCSLLDGPLPANPGEAARECASAVGTVSVDRAVHRRLMTSLPRAMGDTYPTENDVFASW